MVKQLQDALRIILERPPDAGRETRLAALCRDLCTLVESKGVFAMCA